MHNGLDYLCHGPNWLLKWLRPLISVCAKFDFFFFYGLLEIAQGEKGSGIHNL